MKYAVYCYPDDAVYVVDAPKDDRHAIVDAVAELGGEVFHSYEVFLKFVESVSKQYRVDASTARQMMLDHGAEIYRGLYVNWNAIFYEPYPPHTRIGRYPYQCIWEPKYTRFRGSHR